MSEMIAAEPAHSERLLHRLAEDEVLETVASAVRAAVEAAQPIHVTGCGTSEHAAMAIVTLLTRGPRAGAGPGAPRHSGARGDPAAARGWGAHRDLA